MAQNNAAPTSIVWNKQYNGRNGVIHEFSITMANGDNGIFTTTKKEQTKFTIGQAVDYTTEDKEDNRGNQFVKIDKVSTSTTGYGKGSAGGGKSPEVERGILASVCLDCAVILVDKSGIGNNVEPDLKGVYAIAEKFFKHITDASAGDRQKNINYQSRLKLVVNHMTTFKKLEINSSDKVLGYVDAQVEWLAKKMK